MVALLLLFGALPRTVFAQGDPALRDSAFAAVMDEGYAALRAGDTARAIQAFERAIERRPDVATPHFELGYLLLQRGRKEEAVRRFEEGLARDHEQDAVRRQLGYLYAEVGRTDAALEVFRNLRDAGRAVARDHYAIGVLTARRADWSDAARAYREAERLAASAGDSALVLEARAGLSSVGTQAGGPGTFTELYLAPFYQERFDNAISLGFLRAGVRGGSWWRPSLYLSLRATRDSRSTGGQQPILFNDNTVIPALGIRVQPGGGPVALYAEAGAAYDLVARPEREWHRDLRAGANLAWQREHSLSRMRRSPQLVSEVNADATYYERFDRNVIAFGLLRESLRFRPADSDLAFDLFARGWGAMDSRGDFFNRVVEGGGGVAVHLPLGGLRTSVYLDVLRGRYLETPPATSGLPRSYNDWRVTVTTGLFRFRPFSRP
jgi:tetratricopeptide (TPR) repeat protein